MIAPTNKSLAIRKQLGLALILGIFQLLVVQVHSQRASIRGEYQRPDRDRIGSSTYQRERPGWSSTNGNDTDEDVTVATNNQDANPNLVLVPQCNPSNSDSFYSQSKREENRDSTDYLEDTTTDCDRYLQYCDKKRSNLSMSWPNYVRPDDFYNTVELLYDRCFKSCVEQLPGGVEEFCSMPKPQDDAAATAEYTSASSGPREYCESVDNSDWTVEMITHEAIVLHALNVQRAAPNGQVCTRRTGDNVSTSDFFPRSSPVVTNDSLRCAARIQARNIVDATIEDDRFPSNLHKACPSSSSGGGAPVCEDFATRMVNSGYSYNGFGYINEVTAAGYQLAETVIQGWLDSQSGHCSAVVKQESLVVPTEVGIGYYRDEATGMTGHVMLVAQRQL